MKRRAFTLLETVIAIALTTLVAGAALAFLLQGRHSFTSALARTRVSQSAHAFTLELPALFSQSSADSLTLGTDPPAVAFLTAFDQNGQFRTDSQGYPDWQAYDVFYQHEDRLLRRRVDFEGDSAQPLTLESLTSMCQGTGNVLVSEVKGLTLEQQDGSVVIVAELAISEESGRGSDTTYHTTWVSSLSLPTESGATDESD